LPDYFVSCMKIWLAFYMVIHRYWSGFVQLFFPEICITCGEKLVNQEKFVCLKCLYDIPRTDFHNLPGNKLEEQFWGRIKVERASSYFYFRKGSRYQKLIHFLKYKGLKEIGERIGFYFGNDLSEAPGFSSVDVVIPVPLHPQKQKKRGYNQSEWIAKGIGLALNKPVESRNLKRLVNKGTQTKKSKFERWENVEGIFDVENPEELQGKHVLLIDDVITTGATIEACCSALLKVERIRISLASLAFADN
jgi:ComF family protein